MREVWEKSTLGESCQIKPPKKEARNRLAVDDMVSFVPMNSLGIRQKGFEAAEDRALQSVSGSYTYFAEGDVLLAKITPCFENGKLGLARGLTNGVGFGSSEFIVFRPKETLDAEYLFYFLSQDSFRDAGAKVMSGAVGHKRVPKEFIADLPLPLPPLPEQKRIVAILDDAFASIDAAVANTEKNLANARKLFESYLDSVFSQRDDGWVEMPLSDIASIRSALVDPRKSEFSDLSHVGAGNITSKTGEIVNVQTAYEEGLKSGKFLFDNSMVLYSKIRPYLEKVAKPDFSGLCSADIYPLSPNAEHLCRNFLYYMLLSKDFTDYAVAGSARAGMPKVNRGHLFQYRAVLPSVSEQKRLVGSLEDVASESQRLGSIYQQKLTALAELKQSLLQKAFSGELTAEKVDENNPDEVVA